MSLLPIIVPQAGEALNAVMLRQFRLLEAGFYSYATSSATGTIGNAFTNVSSASATTQTLPSAASYVGSVTIRNSGAGLITVDGAGSETINGKTSIHLWKGNSVTMISDGANWVITSWVPIYIA